MTYPARSDTPAESGGYRDIQRLVFRCLGVFIIEEAQSLASAAGGDATDGITFISITQREDRSGVSAGAISAALGIPAETIRRRVIRLIDDGLVERDLRGLLVASAAQTDRQRARWAATVDRFFAATSKLEALGYSPVGPLPDRTLADRDLARCAHIIDGIMIRLAEGSVAVEGSITLALVFMAVMHLNVLHLTYDKELAWRYSGASTPPPHELRRPASPAQVAKLLNMSPETIRRRLNEMVDLGRCEKRPDGYLATEAFINSPDMLSTGLATVQAFVQAQRELIQFLEALKN